MRIAIVSDIHGNEEAFQAVLRDVDRVGIDRIFSLGDNIGYGANPEEVVRLLRSLAIPSVMGNHELGIVDPASHAWFNQSALRSLQITRGLLSDETIEFLPSLPARLTLEGGLMVHGSPPDSITRYIFEVSWHEMVGLLSKMEQSVCFVGHTHVLMLYTLENGQIQELALQEGAVDLPVANRFIINTGSVGQPRDGDNRAKYLVWDPGERRLEIHCVPYDIAKAAAKIIDKGFPRFNAQRLWGPRS